MVVVKQGRDIKWAEGVKEYMSVGVKGLESGAREFTLADLPGLPDGLVRSEVAPKVGGADDGKGNGDVAKEGLKAGGHQDMVG